MVDGWPISHHVFDGNWHDAKTVPEVLDDLEQRFGLKRVVFVGDRGMVTSHNLALVRERGHGYIVGAPRCRPDIRSEKATPPKTLVQEVASKEPGVRVFVVHSDERAAYESYQRAKAMERVRTGLEKLQQRAASGAPQGS
jgi:transposase